MLSGHKKVNMILEMKFQDKTKSKRCDFALQKNDSRSTLLLKMKKERASILEHVQSNMGIPQTSSK